MNITMAIAAIVGMSLLYALHAILILRWCGMWTQSRRLALWIGQMLFPITTGLAAVVVGSMIGEGIVALIPGFPTGPMSPLYMLTVALPPTVMVTGAFLLTPLLTMPRRRGVWLGALAGAPVFLLAGGVAFYLMPITGASTLWALLAWHLGALGAPLWLAWRVRKRHMRELAGHLCLDCGYDLSLVTLDRCPECGAKRRDRPAAQPA